ncbi:MAG: hypothetical protein ACK5LS_01915 [Propioniciclava sp.]
MLDRSHPVDGRRTLTFRLRDHGPVSVVGSFNAWTPGVLVLAETAGGELLGSVEVAADIEVRFRYLGGGGRWFDEPDADRIDAGGSVIDAVGESFTGVPSPAEVAAVKEAKLRHKRARMARAAQHRRREIEEKRIAAEVKAARKAEKAEARASALAAEAAAAAEEARAAVAKAEEKARQARLAHRLKAERREKASAKAAAAAVAAAAAEEAARAAGPGGYAAEDAR